MPDANIVVEQRQVQQQQVQQQPQAPTAPRMRYRRLLQNKKPPEVKPM
jgi:hypothetical protein